MAVKRFIDVTKERKCLQFYSECRYQMGWLTMTANRLGGKVNFGKRGATMTSSNGITAVAAAAVGAATTGGNNDNNDGRENTRMPAPELNYPSREERAS